MSQHKRISFIITLFSLFLLVLGACAAPPGQPAPAGGEEAAPAPARNLPADAAKEQVLRINTGSTGASSFTFYPLAGGGDQQSWMPLLYVPPLYFDVDLNLKPGVLNSWKNNDTFTVWTFTIDPRAQFSDGSPITPEDVVGTWTLMVDPTTEMGRIPQYLGNVKGFDELREGNAEELAGLSITDDGAIQVELVNPDPIFHWRIATTHMNPVKIEQALADRENFWLPENNPAVSGPYMLSSYDPDLQEATMVPNPNWWMEEGPYLERIEFRFQPDPETLAVMLQNDQVDASLTSPPLALKDQFPDYFRPIKSFGFNTLWFAATVEPTSDKNVRKALVLSVNGDDLFKAAFPEGNATKATQIIDPDLPCQETEMSWYPYDPDAAKAALAASQYGSAENLPKLRVTPRGTNLANNRAVEAVMEFWRQNLGITNVEFQQRPDGFGEDEPLINLSRDDVVIRFPDSATYMWVAAHSKGPIARGSMMKGYKNPEIDALLEEALALPVEDPQRCELALQAQRLFMDDYPAILFGIPISTLNAREYVRNYFKGPDVGLIEPWKIYIAEH